jgi:hypothetical protein
MACSQPANPRTTRMRIRSQLALATSGDRTHPSAASTVIRSWPCSSSQSMN